MKRTSTAPAVRRANNGQYSQQPRFHQESRGGMFANLMSFVKRTTEQMEIPAYIPNSMPRDQWLQKNWAAEPHWAGVLYQAALIDSTRKWSITGGRNQVKRFSNMLHQADGGKGWRNYFFRGSFGFRATDMGSNTEWGRNGAAGPLMGIYHLDSSRCKWTGFNDYMPEPQLILLDKLITRRDALVSRGGSEAALAELNRAITDLTQRWAVMEYHSAQGTVYYPKGQFFNVTSMPNPQDAFNGLGYCQTSRAWDILRLMYSVLMHDQELTGARMPKGIMFLHNVTEDQWDTMLRGREAQLDGREALYFGGLMIIASEGDVTPDGKLVALSQLPANFDRATFIDQTMYGYALVSGYDPREFWPVSGGALGTGTETETQHRKAIGKGAMEFPQGWQDRFQQELPPTLLFQFEERDAEGELIDAEVAQAWTNVATSLYTAGLPAVPGLLDQQAALKLLADKSHILNPDDVMIMSEAIATDEETTEVTERALQTPQVRRAIERYPDEPIVQYTWPTGVERVLWERGDDALKPRVWAVDGKKAQVSRADKDSLQYIPRDRRAAFSQKRIEYYAVLISRGMTDLNSWNLASDYICRLYEAELNFEAMPHPRPEPSVLEMYTEKQLSDYREMRGKGFSPGDAFDVICGSVERQAVLAEVLYESPDGDVVITGADVNRAVADWDRTMPDEAVGLLEAEGVE